MNFKNLSFRITFIVAISIFTIELVIGIFSVITRKSKLLEERRSRFQSIARVLESRWIGFPEDQKKEELEQELKKVAREFNINSIIFRDKNSKQFLQIKINNHTELENSLQKEKDYVYILDTSIGELYRFIIPIEQNPNLQFEFDYLKDNITNELITYSYNITGLVFIIILFVTVVISISMYLFVVKPIISIKKELQASITEKSVNLNKELSIQTHDEVSEIAISINDFIRKIRKIVHQVRKNSDFIQDYTKLILFTTSKKLTEEGENILNANKNIAKGAEEQSKEISNITSWIQQIQVEMKNLQDQYDASSQVVQYAVNVANNGSKIAKESSLVMERLNENIQSTFSVLETLEEKSKRINKVIDVISRIASQINLLSLNASIESERAGEVGRGFAVVADEIKKLADESMRSTKDISLFVQDIKTTIEQTIRSMKKSNQEYSNNHVYIKELVESFNEIADKVQNIESSTEQTKHYVKNQNKHINKIQNYVFNINKKSEEYVLVTEEANRNANEQKKSINEIDSVLNEVQQVAEDLNSLVEVFKIDDK